ncbi:MAG: hypothetical protein ACKOZX_10845 [Gammaproteobacteria bacterium]
MPQPAQAGERYSLIGAWAAWIGAANTMVLGGIISIVATLVIARIWSPIREYRSPA